MHRWLDSGRGRERVICHLPSVALLVQAAWQWRIDARVCVYVQPHLLAVVRVQVVWPIGQPVRHAETGRGTGGLRPGYLHAIAGVWQMGRQVRERHYELPNGIIPAWSVLYSTWRGLLHKQEKWICASLLIIMLCSLFWNLYCWYLIVVMYACLGEIYHSMEITDYLFCICRKKHENVLFLFGLHTADISL